MGTKKTNETIEDLLIQIYQSPQSAIQKLQMAVHQTKDTTLLFEYHRLLSIGYALQKDSKLELKQIKLSEKYAISPTEILYLKSRKAAYYLSQSKNVKALSILSSAYDDYKNLKINDINLLFQIKLNLILILRNIGDELLQSLLLDELKKEINSLQSNLIQAHFYMICGMIEFDDEMYDEAIQSYEYASSIFTELALADKAQELELKVGIALYKRDNYIVQAHFDPFLHQYEKHLLDPTFLEFIVNLGAHGIDPFLIKKFSDTESITILKHFEHQDDLYAFHIFSIYVRDYFTQSNSTPLIGSYLEEIDQLNDAYQKKLKAIKETKAIFQEEMTKFETHSETINEVNDPNVSHTLQSIHSFLKINLDEVNQVGLLKNKNLDASKLLWNDFSSQIAINSIQGIEFFETNSIARLEADGPYTALIEIDNKTHLSSKNLAFYEERLDPTQFLRIHRSTIVNRKYIKKFHNGRIGIIELSNGVTLEVASRRVSEIRLKLANQINN